MDFVRHNFLMRGNEGQGGVISWSISAEDEGIHKHLKSMADWNMHNSQIITSICNSVNPSVGYQLANFLLRAKGVWNYYKLLTEVSFM